MKRIHSVLGMSLVAIALALAVFACKKEPGADPFSRYDRKALLRNLGNHLILPAFQAFQGEAGQLKTAAQAFAQAPNQATLQALQQQWRVTAAAWKLAELYKKGPVEDQFLGVAVDYWPANTSGIETIINSASTLNNDYVETKANSLKGMPALEYLLFDPKEGNAATLEKYTTGQQAAQRLHYLQALAVNLSTKADAIVAAWQGAALMQFIESDGRGVSSSLGLLTNQMIVLAESVKNIKLGVPLGTFTGTAQPGAVEAGLSRSSLRHIQNNLLALEKTFTGRQATGQDGPGLDDLLDALHAQQGQQPLSAVIKAQFAKVNSRLEAIDLPLQEAVVQKPELVESAYQATRELIVLLKVDMASQLGVLLTFSDNDGD